MFIKIYTKSGLKHKFEKITYLDADFENNIMIIKSKIIDKIDINGIFYKDSCFNINFDNIKRIVYENDINEDLYNLVEKAKNDPNWDSNLNSKLCSGDCLNCCHLIKKK